MYTREREREKGWLDVLPTEGAGCTMVVSRQRSGDPGLLILYGEGRGQVSYLIGGKTSEG